MSNVLFPSIPAAVWLGREWLDQSSALRARLRLRDCVERLWPAQIKQDSDEPWLEHERRGIAGLLFMFRCYHPTPPYFLELLGRDEKMRDMREILDDYINDSLNARAGSTRHAI